MIYRSLKATRDGRVRNFAELEDCLAAEFLTKSRVDWMLLLDRHDVPFAPIQPIAEVLDDPQIRHLGTFYKLSHPREGEVVGINRPIWIDGGREINRRPPPALGEHSAELLDELGFASETPQGLNAKVL